MASLLNKPIDKERRATIAVAAVVGGAGAVAAAVPFVKACMPSERAKAAGAPVEADIRTSRRAKWLGRVAGAGPCGSCVARRKCSQSIREDDSKVADPKSLRTKELTPEYARNEYRSMKPEYLVVVGICSHLGCHPLDQFKAGAKCRGGPNGDSCVPATARRSISRAGSTRTSRRPTT